MQLQTTLSNFSDFCQTRNLNGKYEEHYILKVLRKSLTLFFFYSSFVCLSFKALQERNISIYEVQIFV